MNKFIKEINGLKFAKDTLTGDTILVKDIKYVSFLPPNAENKVVYILEDGLQYYASVMSFRQVKLEAIKEEKKENKFIKQQKIKME